MRDKMMLWQVDQSRLRGQAIANVKDTLPCWEITTWPGQVRIRQSQATIKLCSVHLVERSVSARDQAVCTVLPRRWRLADGPEQRPWLLATLERWVDTVAKLAALREDQIRNCFEAKIGLVQIMQRMEKQERALAVEERRGMDDRWRGDADQPTSLLFSTAATLDF